MPANHLTKNEESILVDTAIAGDETAWTRLYETFILPLRGFLRGRISHIEDVEDLAHECFIRAHGGLMEGRYDRQYRFYTFLRGIAHHLILDYWRNRSNDCMRFDESVTQQENQQREARILSRPLERLELLHLVLSCSAKPHQIIMFCFVKLLEWRPREIVDERSDEQLSALTEEFLHTYFDALSSFVSKNTFFEDVCSPLAKTMVVPAVHVYTEREYQTIGSITESPVGSLKLDVFFGGNPAANISDWCDRVKTRTRKMLRTANIMVNSDDS